MSKTIEKCRFLLVKEEQVIGRVKLSTRDKGFKIEAKIGKTRYEATIEGGSAEEMLKLLFSLQDCRLEAVKKF